MVCESWHLLWLCNNKCSQQDVAATDAATGATNAAATVALNVIQESKAIAVVAAYGKHDEADAWCNIVHDEPHSSATT